MASNNSVPSWMSEVKEDAIKTSEWAELSKHIYDAVDQHLSQSHVSYFTDLTEAEKSLLLERAARSLAASNGGRIYEDLQSKLSYLLDQSVNNQVAKKAPYSDFIATSAYNIKKVLEDRPLDTKTDLALDTTSEGIISLLRKHPDQKYKLRIFLNQVIPSPLRFLAWQLFFANINYKKIFINKLATNPKLCLSPQDAEIQRKCESLLNSVSTFKDMRDSRGNLNSMKGILSYYHTTLTNKRPLNESEYLYAAALVNTHYPLLPKNESPTERSMAMLIEIFLQFIATLPGGIMQALNGASENPEMEIMIKSLINILDQYDPALLDYLKELSRNLSSPGIEEITFQTAFKSLCVPLMKNLFSGYLSLNPLMFVWDQYAISADVPGYHEELVPIIAAIILMILRDQLMAVHTVGEMDECLKKQSSFIQTRQIQTILNKYFFKNLQTKINSANRFGPVIDPTAGRLTTWEHWHQDIIPRRTMKIREQDDNDERLKAEVNRRLQSEKAARDEIERLRRELESLKNKPQPVPRQPSPKPAKVVKKAEPASQQPLADLFKRVKNSVDKIGQGEGNNKVALDVQTSEDLKLHKLDLKIAENEVFGHALTKREWEKLSDSDKKLKSEQMLEVVKNRIEKRYKETGRF